MPKSNRTNEFGLIRDEDCGWVAVDDIDKGIHAREVNGDMDPSLLQWWIHKQEYGYKVYTRPVTTDLIHVQEVPKCAHGNEFHECDSCMVYENSLQSRL